MKQHAFLITVHKQPQLLGRIVKVLAQENHHFFIHVDKKGVAKTLFQQACDGIANVHFVENNIAVYHAGISQVHASLRLLNQALANPITIDYFHIISGQDYPLRSNQQFDRFFEQTSHSYMYIDHGEFKQSMLKTYHEDTRLYHFNNTHTFVAKAYKKLRLHKFLGLFYKRKPIPDISGGWDWFTWNRKVATFVVDYIQ